MSDEHGFLVAYLDGIDDSWADGRGKTPSNERGVNDVKFLSNQTAPACKPAQPVSVLIIQGTEDPLVPFQGGALGENGDRGGVLSHDATVQKFVALNHCQTSPQSQRIPDTARDGTVTSVAIYEGCSAGTEVRSYVVEGAEHTWPGGIQYLPSSIIGKTSRNFDASETIWEFFAAHAH